jgi:hypothetical protein
VDVEVEDGLSGTRTDVEDGTISLLDVALAGDLGGGEMAPADDLGVGRLGFFQSAKVSLGDDEDVCGCLGIDVFEGENMIVFVNFFGGDLAAKDTAEEATGITHRILTLGKR